MKWLFCYFKTITYSVFALSGTAVYGEIRGHGEIENALVLSFCDVLVHKNKAESCIFAPKWPIITVCSRVYSAVCPSVFMLIC